MSYIDFTNINDVIPKDLVSGIMLYPMCVSADTKVPPNLGLKYYNYKLKILLKSI